MVKWNETDGTRDSLFVWIYPSLKLSEVMKGFPDKCKTIIIPSKNRAIQRVAEEFKGQVAIGHGLP